MYAIGVPRTHYLTIELPIVKICLLVESDSSLAKEQSVAKEAA